MAKITGSHPAVAALASALGLDPRNTKSIDLHLAVGDVATARVGIYITDDQLELLAVVVREYNLVLEEVPEYEEALSA
jgi:hypothetical protein